MINFLTVGVFLFGTLIGSFLNVVILRYGTGKKIFGMGERSMCFSCGKTLHWFELFPIFSFLYQRGRCRGCKTKVSWQYPLVECATGLLFVAIAFKNFSGATFEEVLVASHFTNAAILTLFHFVIWSILVVITVYDIRHKIIPDFLVFMFAGLSLITSIFFPEALNLTVTGAIFAGIALFAFFGGLWLVSGGRWLGFGDAKLVLGVGFLLGPILGLSALVLSFWIGAVVSIGIIGWQRIHRAIQGKRLPGHVHNLTMKSEIPFAPFIILGTLVAFFWSIDIFGIAAFF